jgi:hypothetical protein
MKLKRTPENVMVVVRAIVPLIVIIGLFTILINLGMSKISEIRAQIDESKKEQAVLTEKLEMLRTIAVTGVEDSNVAINGLPDTSPSLLAMAQLKTLAAGSNVVLRSLKSVSSTETEDLNSIETGFGVIGGKMEIENFLKQVNTFAPISFLSSVKLAQSGDAYLGNVSVITYWAPLPTKLPATIGEFKDLTPEDRETLSDLSSLNQPTFLNLPPADLKGRDDPFGQ